MRERIMIAAAEEMGRHSIKFTMHDLAKRLGISKRTLYTYFRSKEELIEAIVVAMLEDIKQQCELIVRNEQLDWTAKLYRIMVVQPRVFMAIGRRSSEDIRRYIPAIWKNIERFVDGEWASVEIILREGIKEKHFRTIHVPLIVKIIKGAFKEMLQQESNEYGPCCMSEMKGALAEMLLYGIVRDRVSVQQ